MTNEINPSQKKIWLFAGVITALGMCLFFNVFLAYYLLSNLAGLTFSLNFFPPGISLLSEHVQSSFSLYVFMLYDFILILFEIEIFLLITRKIKPPLKFGFLSLLLALIGILLLNFIYKSVILVFMKGAGETNISLLYLFYSRQQILLFLFFAFLVTFGYLTYVINRIKNLLETFPKEEENVATKR